VSTTEDAGQDTLSGLPSAAALGLTQLVALERVTSTMDEAHARAERGASAGTLVMAATQDAGRGRSGKSWHSAPGAGLWCTLIERPADTRALDVLALRVGLALADALSAFVEEPIGLKWPNDLLLGTRKVAGILIEVRWRDGRPEWVAIGMGINRRLPAEVPHAAAVRETVPLSTLLSAIVPPVRSAARAIGVLTAEEREAWARRDVAVGREIVEPLAGVVLGIAPSGALLVRTADGANAEASSGSLVFA
jgi:BirA family transcriptional regulator, biotin operon repressor / biotin---[acetyl-CoA-carboxylase] ligase